MRKCGCCKHLLDEASFSVNPKTQDYFYKCDLCREKQKDYYKANKEKIAEKRKEYYIANKDKLTKYKKEYNEMNKANQKEYYKANKDQIAKNGKEYRKANKEKIAKKNKIYHKANRPKIAVSHSKHSDIKHNRYTEAVKRDYITAQFLIDTFNEQNGLCYYCCRQMDFKTEPYADHLATVERLDNFIGHTKSNCVVACLKCNVGRQTMEIDIFKNKISKQ